MGCERRPAHVSGDRCIRVPAFTPAWFGAWEGKADHPKGLSSGSQARQPGLMLHQPYRCSRGRRPVPHRIAPHELLADAVQTEGDHEEGAGSPFGAQMEGLLALFFHPVEFQGN